MQAGYAADAAVAAALPAAASRAVFVSALAIDTTGLATLRKSGVAAKVSLSLDKLALPAGAVITNIAVLLPGVEGGNFSAELKFGSAAPTAFKIDNGLALSNKRSAGRRRSRECAATQSSGRRVTCSDRRAHH